MMESLSITGVTPASTTDIVSPAASAILRHLPHIFAHRNRLAAYTIISVENLGLRTAVFLL